MKMKLELMKRMSLPGLALAFAVLAAMTGCATRSVEAEFPYAIDFVPYAANWGRFAPGDDITITAVRGDRTHIEPGGRYLVMGTYTLSSMDRAKLGLSITAPSANSPGAYSEVDPEQVASAVLGTHAFMLKETMNYPGSFHVSFQPINGGESISTIYFKESLESAGARD